MIQPLQIVCVTVSSVVLVIVVPLCAYWTYQLESHKHKPFMRKRSAKLSIVTNSVLICLIVILTCRMASSIVIEHQSQVPQSIMRTELLIIIILFWLSLWSVLYLLLVQAWLVFYNLKWTHITLRSKWESIITQDTQTQPWLLKETTRKTYGNLHWVVQRMAIAVVLFAFFTLGGCLLIASGFLFGLFIPVATFALPLFGYCTIYCLIPVSEICDDSLWIYGEYRAVARLLAALVGTFITMLISAVTVHPSSPYLVDWISVVGSSFMILLTTAMVLVKTRLVIRKNIDGDELLQRLKQGVPSISAVASPSMMTNAALDSSPSALPGPEVAWTLTHTLSNASTFQLFMTHLGNEYAMECLLACLELWQFIECCNGWDDYMMKTIEFSERLPQSAIVRNRDTDHKAKLYELYLKYVSALAPYQVTLPSDVKQSFDDVMLDAGRFVEVNISQQDAVTLAYDAYTFTLRLMMSSFNRFRTGHKFEKVKRILSRSTTLAA